MRFDEAIDLFIDDGKTAASCILYIKPFVFFIVESLSDLVGLRNYVNPKSKLSIMLKIKGSGLLPKYMPVGPQ